VQLATLCYAVEGEVGGFLMRRASRSIRVGVGEGREEGRRHPPLKPLYSTMHWMEEVAMVRRLRLGSASLHS
jgi:hypothetical protein